MWKKKKLGKYQSNELLVKSESVDSTESVEREKTFFYQKQD